MQCLKDENLTLSEHTKQQTVQPEQKLIEFLTKETDHEKPDASQKFEQYSDSELSSVTEKLSVFSAQS